METGKVYRVIWDEPVGFCVGFKPEGVEADEYTLGSDVGTIAARYFRVEGNVVHLVDTWTPECEPQDMLLWLEESHFNAWLAEMEAE